MSTYKIVLKLTIKCIKSIIRNPSLRLLIILSSLSVFIVLYSIWIVSRGNVLKYSSSSKYSNLNFNIICEPVMKLKHKIDSECYSNDQSNSDDLKQLTPTDILLNIIYGGSMYNSNTNKNDFAILLSSVLMNGFPLLGFNDFIKLSDFVNKNLGIKGRYELLNYESTKEQLGNFLDIRNKEIRLTPRNCWTKLYSQHLIESSNYIIIDDDDNENENNNNNNNNNDNNENNNNNNLNRNETSNNKLKIKIFDDMNSAINMNNNMKDNVLAIIEIKSSSIHEEDLIAYEYEYKTKYENFMNSYEICSKIIETITLRNENKEDKGPHITIRMDPTVVADTRNYEWSPRKNPLPRNQSGQLLYFISSFLTIQLEIQNFLSILGLGGPIIPLNNFNDEFNVMDTLKFPKKIADIVLQAKSPDDIFYSIVNSTDKYSNINQKPISIPLYNRAYPTHRYLQNLFWHLYSTMLPIVLILFFSIPAAVTAGSFWREYLCSQLEVLCTLPTIRVYHSVISWCICCSIWTFFYFIVSYTFFVLVLPYDAALIPSLNLLLCGIALAPISMLLGLLISRPDALVVAVPSFVFVSMLPGLLYNDLAFDVQRTMWFELLICLLPPSAVALIIRQICGLESFNIKSTWIYPAPVSNTPLYYYTVLLIFDCFLYSIMSTYLIKTQRVNISQYRISSLNNLESLSQLSFSERILNNLLSCRQYILKSLGAILKHFSNMISYFNGDQMYVSLPIEHYGSIQNPLSGTVDSYQFEQNESYHIQTPSMSSYRDDNNYSDESSSVGEDENLVMSIKNINKLYVTAGIGISVLQDFTSKLFKGSVTCLLGSNGCGKTTLLKILCGIDAAYDGSINVVQNDENSNRIIGWCPQHDPLYDFLTVTEHLELFQSLLDESKIRIETLEEILSRLDMSKHRYKLACELSGGMKRRLSLALAFIGEPQVLLLDEPSSGCDSWTRELVRKDILSRKNTAAILVSTHHIDDVEVLSDRIWFLNDRYLAFDGPVSQLFKQAISKDVDGSFMGMDFSSSDDFVKRQFMNKFTDNDQWLVDNSGDDSNSLKSINTWQVPFNRCGDLKDFVTTLEARQNCSWSIGSPSIHRALATLYSIKDNNNNNNSDVESLFIKRAFHDFENETKKSQLNFVLSFIYMIARQSKAIIVIRFIDVSRQIPHFLLTHIILPFFIVLLITYACRDISYPKVELSSRNIGAGEVIASIGNNTNSEKYTGRSLLEKSIESFTWLGNLNSDSLWQRLYRYYYHHDKNRWASFVINDYIDEWMESTVILKEESLNFSVSSAFEQIENAKKNICFTNKEQDSIVCENNLKISIIKNTIIDPSNNSIIEINSLKFQTKQSLNSNLTMLSNVTMDHAAPVFLKEVAPIIYGSRNLNKNQKLESPYYKLFSHPLPKTKNFSSQNYIQRGYLGSMMIVLYMLLCTIKSVRFVTLFRRSGMKRQLHMSGLNITAYWLSNYVSDVSLILVTVLATAIAIIVGGSPVSNFFINYPPFPGALFLSSVFTFSSAIVATSYAYSVQSSDQLSSQLLNLMSTVIDGVFMKLFLDRHKYEPYESLGRILLWISPCFNFSASLFEMFSVHIDDLKHYYEAKDLNHKIEMTVALVSHYNKIMIIQTIVYLLITIILDGYLVRVKALLKTIKFWIISFIREINFERNIFQRLKILILSCGGNQNELEIIPINQQFSSSNIQINVCDDYDIPSSPTSIGSISTSSPRSPIRANGGGVNKYLSNCDEIGFFPDIDPHVYKNARRRKRMENFLRSSKVGYHGTIIYPQQHLSTPNQSAPSSPVSSINSDAIVEPVVHIEDLYIEHVRRVNITTKEEKLINNNSNHTHTALNGLNLDIHEGERIALIGLNGGGKTTLFETLAMAELTPINGEVCINGMNLVSQSLSIGENGIVGYVPQFNGLFDFLTVDQTLSLFYDIKMSSKYDNIIKVDDFGIGILPNKYWRYPVHSLSGGNKKKLAVVAASMFNPDIILLDEPTSGVDPVASEKIVSYLNDLQSVKCMLFSSHRVSECMSLCNRVVILNDGCIFLEGPISVFGELSSRFYQVDITIKSFNNFEDVLEKIVNISGGFNNIERIVQYTSTLVRITYEKKLIAQSKIWGSLLMLQNDGLILSFLFRIMDMEETLSSIMSSK